MSAIQRLALAAAQCGLWRHLDRLQHGDDDQQDVIPLLPEYCGDADGEDQRLPVVSLQPPVYGGHCAALGEDGVRRQGPRWLARHKAALERAHDCSMLLIDDAENGSPCLLM